MDHKEAVRQHATERYLLDELDPELRDQFEEHLFDCQDCAMDVRAAAMFVEQSKAILAEPAVALPVRQPAPATVKPGLFAWLRPAFAVPVFALLLAVIGYQNFVTYPKLTAAANQPQAGPWVSVNVETRGAAPIPVKTSAGEGFGLVLNLPPTKDGFASYGVDLYNPAGKLEWSASVPAASSEEGRQIYIPGRNRVSGTYKLVVHGVTAAGKAGEFTEHPIELQIQ